MLASVEFFGMTIHDLVQSLIGIAILYFVIYALLHYLRNTRGAVVLFGLFITWLVLSLLAPLLGLQVIAYILTSFGNSLLLTLFILFQPEIRRALAQIGMYAFGAQQHSHKIIDELVAAAENLALRKHGALIVEDAAESLGARYKLNGRWVETGTLGDYNCISFNGNKIITGSCGGMFLTDSRSIRDVLLFPTMKPEKK